MPTDTISPLRQRMIEDMNARKLCAGTQRGHISSCKRFAAFLRRSPDTATAEDIRRFQLHLAEAGLSICNRNRIMTGLRFLFRVTLRRLDLAGEIYHLREPQKIPLVMSPDEARRLLAVASKLKVPGRLMFTVIGAIACFERELMLERQREGIAKAKAEGKYKGRKPTARARAAEIATLKADGVRPTDIARQLGIGRASVYRILESRPS